MVTFSGQLRETVSKFGNGALFTSHGVKKNFFPGVDSNSIHQGISYLVKQGCIERTDSVDDNGYRQYRVLNSVSRINDSFKTRGHAGTKNLMAYKEQMRSRPLIDVLIFIENQIKALNTRLGEALTLAGTSTAAKALETYSVPELLAEISRRHATQ